MTVSDCQALVYRRLLTARNLYTTVTTDKFADIFDKLDNDQQLQIIMAINNEDLLLLRQLLKRFQKIDVDLLPIRELRLLGKEHKILHYAMLPKSVLLANIKRSLNDRALRNNATTIRESEDSLEEITRSIESVLDARAGEN